MSVQNELSEWSYRQMCERAVEALGKRGFVAVYCPDAAAAREYVLQQAQGASTVGFGGSLSVAGLGIIEALEVSGKELLIHGSPGLSKEERLQIMRRQLTCDLFLTGTNALTLSGILVNIDASGNRAGSMFFGPARVIVVAGRNKLVHGDVDDAVRRVKNFASPPNARRLGFTTPCAKTGFCSDCASPDRICRITTIIEMRPRMTDVHVLVVNEELGL